MHKRLMLIATCYGITIGLATHAPIMVMAQSGGSSYSFEYKGSSEKANSTKNISGNIITDGYVDMQCKSNVTQNRSGSSVVEEATLSPATFTINQSTKEEIITKLEKGNNRKVLKFSQKGLVSNSMEFSELCD